MRILLTGQCTLHVGRMEFGNIGNYYIVEPFVRELHRCFPGVEIATTFQMSDEFCARENVTRLPMELYYGWTGNDFSKASYELEIAKSFSKSGLLSESTAYIDEVMNSDLIIDFSGDLWGDNANFLGKDRFLVGLYKNRVAQLLGKKVAMLAGSPGPFADEKTKALAKEVFEHFALVTNREPTSRSVLEKEGFCVDRLVDLACPAYLFEPFHENVEQVLRQEGREGDKPLIGISICGWNFIEGPYDKWPRNDRDFSCFVEVVEYLCCEIGAQVCLVPHSNGFKLPAPPFTLIHGRDYPIIKQLQAILEKRGLDKDVFVLDDIYLPSVMKSIIGRFDMLVSGRVHAAVAGLSQSIPTVIIDYGHEPKAHKLKGFALVARVQELLADPSDVEDVKSKVAICWENRAFYRQHLETHIQEVMELSRRNFELLKGLMDG